MEMKEVQENYLLVLKGVIKSDLLQSVLDRVAHKEETDRNK